MRLKAAGQTLTLGELREALEDCGHPLTGWDENAPVMTQQGPIECIETSPGEIILESDALVDAEELEDRLDEVYDLIREIADGDLKGVAVRKRCAELLHYHDVIEKP